MFYLNDSINIHHCCNQAQVLNIELITEYLVIKLFA